MFLSSKPDRRTIKAFIASSHSSDFSYPQIGCTRLENEIHPKGFNRDYNRIILGVGETDFDIAKAAIRNWAMIDLEWVDLCWPDTLIEEGRTVAVLIRHFGFYSLNAAKIVYVIDNSTQFGFAYGTLAEHGESGEERFMVEMDVETGDVSYDLLAFSRPNHLLARLGYPLARHLQKRFANDSKAAMVRAIRPVLESPK